MTPPQPNRPTDTQLDFLALFLLACFIALLASACLLPTSPDLRLPTRYWIDADRLAGGGVVADRVRPVPVAWRRMYDETAACAGKRETADFDDVRWYEAEALVLADGSGSWAAMFVAPDQIILLRGDTASLRHEALHHVLYRAGWRAPDTSYAAHHPSPPFGICTGGGL